MESKKTIEINNLHKTYKMGDQEVHALGGITASVNSGEFIAIVGTSGSGKSTLMNILGCLDYPTRGDYRLDGVPVSDLDRNQLADIRNRKIGFVFQGFNLLPRTSALENVEIPLLYDRSGRTRFRDAARTALERVDLGDRLHHEPAQLSGGQQQRVAIARALVNQPAIILADEPTGNLDSKTTIEVLSVFRELNRQGITIVLVTHDFEVAGYTRRIIELQDGQIHRDEALEPGEDQ